MWADWDFDWENEHGLVAVGGDLTPRRLIEAYCRGVFPWYDAGMPICWWSPDPRAIFEMDGLHVSRRLRRTLRSGRFHYTLNRDFRGVIRGCAHRPGEGTWLTREMIAAYIRLHELGWAHSVEVWLGKRLVGGIYGVAIGGFFAGESMFHRVSDASKAAMAYLFEHLRQRGFVLFDTQFVTQHTVRMGAIEIPRDDYLRRLEAAIQKPVTFLPEAEDWGDSPEMLG
jgi:leucyl/phenylalanyl-tRNA--protein transferase